MFKASLKFGQDFFEAKSETAEQAIEELLEAVYAGRKNSFNQRVHVEIEDLETGARTFEDEFI